MPQQQAGDPKGELVPLDGGRKGRLHLAPETPHPGTGLCPAGRPSTLTRSRKNFQGMSELILEFICKNQYSRTAKTIFLNCKLYIFTIFATLNRTVHRH